MSDKRSLLNYRKLFHKLMLFVALSAISAVAHSSKKLISEYDTSPILVKPIMAANNVPYTNGAVRAIANLTDGKSIIAGDFTIIGGVNRKRIARLNEDGSLDQSFNANVTGSIYSIAVQSDGKVLIAGDHINFDGNGAARNYILRLNEDGSLDQSFEATTWLSAVRTIVVQVDGKILIGGSFLKVNKQNKSKIARLNHDGWIGVFNPKLSGQPLPLS